MNFNQIFLFALFEISPLYSSVAQLQMYASSDRYAGSDHGSSTQMNRLLRSDSNAHEPRVLTRRNAMASYPTELHALASQNEQDELEANNAIEEIGQFLDQSFDSDTKDHILRVIIDQTTRSHLESDHRPALSQLTTQGGCVVIVLCDYFEKSRRRQVLNWLDIRDSMIHLAYAASAKHNFDIEKSIAQFNELMSTEKRESGHFYGLEEFYRPSHGLGKSNMLGYFQFLIKIYLGVDVLEQIMTQSPNLLNVTIDLILGGMTAVTGSSKGPGDIAFDFINFLYMGAKRNTMQLQPAFGLLFVGVAIIQFIFHTSKKAFKKELSDDDIKNLLYRTIYGNDGALQKIFSMSSQFATDENLWAITAHVPEPNRATNEDGKAHVSESNRATNVYALHGYITGMIRTERLEALDKLFSINGSAIDLCRSARKQGFAIDQWVTNAYDNKLNALIADVRQMFVSMAIAHGHATKEYEPLLDIMAAALKSDPKTYKKKARNLYSSSIATISWKSLISEEVLKCKKAKGRYNKKMIADALQQAHEAYNAAQIRVIDRIFPEDDDTSYEKMIEVLTMRQLESSVEEHSEPDYLESSQN